MSNQKFCKKCGSELSPDMNVCGNCGEPVAARADNNAAGGKSKKGIFIGIGAVVIVLVAALIVYQATGSNVQAADIDGQWQGIATIEKVDMSYEDDGSLDEDVKDQLESIIDDVIESEGEVEKNFVVILSMNEDGTGTMEIPYDGTEIDVKYSRGKLTLDDKDKVGNVGEEVAHDYKASLEIIEDEYSDLRLNGVVTDTYTINQIMEGIPFNLYGEVLYNLELKKIED